MPPNAVDEILHIRQEFETRLRNVPGFRAWGLIRTDDGMITVTLCDDRMGAEESARVAGEFVRGNIPHLVPDPPEVANG